MEFFRRKKNSVFVGRRDKGPKEKSGLPTAEFVAGITGVLKEIQQAYYERALAFRNQNIQVIDTKEEFYRFFTPKNEKQPEIHGGFAWTHWSGEEDVIEKLQDELKVTVRCIPFSNPLGGELEEGTCPFSGNPSSQRVIFSKAY